MEFIKGNSLQGGNSLLAACSTLASECGCKDKNGPSYEANSHLFNIVSKRKESGGKAS